MNVFGLGMNESAFLRMFRCVLVMVASVAINTISISSYFCFHMLFVAVSVLAGNGVNCWLNPDKSVEPETVGESA